MKNKKLREQVKSYIIVTLACVLYALSFDWFYAPNGFTVGGFTGISQIINFFAPILPVGTMVIVLNVPLFIVGLKKFGFAFLCKSIYTMTLSSILIDVVAAIHEFAPMDPLLACLYGGVTLGIASGLLFREETTTGGSELGAWIVRSHVERLSIGNICLGIDLTIILIYAAVFHSLNNALYGALALYITTKVLDLVVYGQNTAKVAYIISDKYEEIMQEMLRRDMGVTLGIASGLLFREETTTGGSELGAWIVRSHVERLSIGNICLGIDLTIILIYAAVFHSLNNALYGALALYITTKVLDLVVYGQNTAKVAYIISDKYEEIMQEMLRRDMGVTLLNGKGGYTGAERPLLFCAIRKKEAVSIKRYIKELDPDAFFIVCDASEVLGEGFGEYDPQGL